ncbi:MAG: hypothetical protein JXQ90_18030 [Cyclobacteriaceae bacterium]
MKNDRIKKILSEYVVSWPTLVLIASILVGVDFSLSQPLYTMVLDMPAIGNILAFGMALLFGILPKVTAKLLAKKSYGLAVFSMVIGLGLLSFIFLGQKEAALQREQNPLRVVMASNTEVSLESSTHVVATFLMGLLYSTAIFLGFLYYSVERNFKPTWFQLSMSQLGREFQYRLLLLKGQFDRASAKPGKKAEAIVGERLRTLETNLKGYKRKLDKLEGQRNYDLQVLANAKARVMAVIYTAYGVNESSQS